jgi:GH25 family lysozyme M1 (1,4-beta-N-acetylmuramidase)
MAFLDGLSGAVRLSAAAVMSVWLAGCGAVTDNDFAETPRAKVTNASYQQPTRSNLYPAKGDNAPHVGVAAVHRLPIHGIDVSR